MALTSTIAQEVAQNLCKKWKCCFICEKIHCDQVVSQYLPDHFLKCKFYQQREEPSAVISGRESRKVNKIEN